MHFWSFQALKGLEQNLEILSEQTLHLNAREWAKIVLKALVLNPQLTCLFKGSIQGAAWPQEI